MINGIDTAAIDSLINQVPGGQAVQQDIKAAFVNLLERVVRESVQNTSTPANTPAPAATPAATLTAAASATPAAGTVSTLWKDANLQGLTQLSNELTADDPVYNEREAMLRDRLDLPELESRLRGYAQSLGVEYSSTDLDGILRNAGYGAAHLGSSDRYMDAVERFTNEAFKNYRERAGNVPSLNA